MADFQIVTDSTTDLSADLVRELDLQVLPLRYMIAVRPITISPAVEK